MNNENSERKRFQLINKPAQNLKKLIIETGGSEGSIDYYRINMSYDEFDELAKIIENAKNTNEVKNEKIEEDYKKLKKAYVTTKKSNHELFDKISEDYKKIKKLEQTIRTLKEPDYDVLNSFMDFLYNDDNISCSALVEISELIDKYRSK